MGATASEIIFKVMADVISVSAIIVVLQNYAIPLQK